jgi:hypothetical protein
LPDVVTATLPASSATLKRYCAHLLDASVSGLDAGSQPPYDEQASFARSPTRRSRIPLEAFTSGSGPLSVAIAYEPVT